VRKKVDAQSKDGNGTGLVGFDEDGERVDVEAQKDMVVLQGPIPLDKIKTARSFAEMLAKSRGVNLKAGDWATWALCGAVGGIAGDGCTSGGRSVSVDQSVGGLAFLVAMKVRVWSGVVGSWGRGVVGSWGRGEALTDDLAALTEN
jgi:hypothetical protein